MGLQPGCLGQRVKLFADAVRSVTSDYEATREGIIHLAGQHYDKSGRLEFIHSETGLRTLKDEFDKVAAHNEHHITQIEMALKQY